MRGSWMTSAYSDADRKAIATPAEAGTTNPGVATHAVGA